MNVKYARNAMDYRNIKINKSRVWGAPTYRRFLLDSALTSLSEVMRGIVVDLGGKRKKIRGSFVPPSDGISRWITINIDKEAAPDIEADITALPLAECYADTALICETLEHVKDPIAVLREAHRVLVPGGKLIGSVPFLYPVHSDPYDYRRWSADGLNLTLLETGFEDIEIFSMGGALGTILMLIEVSISKYLLRNYTVKYPSLVTRLALRATHSLSRFGALLELASLGSNVFEPGNKTTTGYIFLASKTQTTSAR